MCECCSILLLWIYFADILLYLYLLPFDFNSLLGYLGLVSFLKVIKPHGSQHIEIRDVLIMKVSLEIYFLVGVGRV